MKKQSIVFATVLVLGLVFQGGTSAQASGCVSQSAFGKIKNGMSVSKVASIFGTNGKRGAFARAGAFTSEVRSYKTCTPYGAVAISFSNGKVAGKSGIF